MNNYTDDQQKERQSFRNAAILAIVLSIAMVILAIMSSCNPARRLGRIATAHPDAAAEVCSRMFPVKESSKVTIRHTSDTQLIQGPVMYVDCDSARMIRDVHDTTRLIVRTQCPPNRMVRDTITRDSIVTLESSAKVAALTAERDAARIQSAGYLSGRNIWRWISFTLIAYQVVRIVCRTWLKISLP